MTGNLSSGTVQQCSLVNGCYDVDASSCFACAMCCVAEQLNRYLNRTVRELRCPCSRYSCLQHDEGYKIGIALMRKIKPEPGEEFDESTGQEMSDRFNQFWTLIYLLFL